MPHPRLDPDRTTPEKVRAAWVAAVANGDPEALRPLLTDDYEVWAHGAPTLSDGHWRYARGMTNGLPAPPP